MRLAAYCGAPGERRLSKGRRKSKSNESLSH
jgi:hypothetical protein